MAGFNQVRGKFNAGANEVSRVYLVPNELDLPDKVEIDAYFTEGESVQGLLGQTGFFENFKVSFERYKGQFEVEARPSPTRAA
jgi:hypothetical protein